MKTHTQKARGHRQQRKKPTHEEISRLAFQLFEQDGAQHGKDLEHWFNAESMIESNFGYGDSHTERSFDFTD